MTSLEFKEWRESLGLTVRQMAEYLGTSRSTIYRYEDGTRTVSGSDLRLVQILETIRRYYPEFHRKLLQEACRQPQRGNTL